MRIPFVAALVLTTFSFASACGGTTSVNCDAAAQPGLLITVVDASTQAAPSSAPSVSVTEGAYAENYSAPNAAGAVPTFKAAIERVGTYALTVSASGYRPFTRTGLVVAKGGTCNQVQTVNVKAALIQLAN
jgi:hypothetical protein